jgi:hypothetical protein
MINDVMMGLMVYMSLFICFVLCYWCSDGALILVDGVVRLHGRKEPD